MDDRDISIIIPVLNEEKRIENCLNSIYNQNFKGSFIVIIVDNGCTDNTFEVIKHYPYIKIVHDFGSLGSARQTGIETAKSPKIVFIDADEVADENWLTELYKYSENFDAVLGSIKTSPINKNNKIHQYFSSLSNLSISYTPKELNIITFGSGNVLINREKTLSVGFDRFMPTSEDGDFSYRFLKNKNTIRINPNAIIYHEVPDSIFKYIKYQEKLAYGQILLIKKHKNIDLVNQYFISLLYPISPLFISRIIRTEREFKLYYLILGLINFLVFIFSLYKLLLPNSSQKIIRPK